MKESEKWKKIKRKKLLQSVFLVAICLMCVIMYKNGQGAEVCVELAPQIDISEKLPEPDEQVKVSAESKADAEIIPSEAEELSFEGGYGRIDINRAAKEELMSLNGIGESKADAILRYREEYGAFESAEDIMKVPGIKEGTFGKIKDKIKV